MELPEQIELRTETAEAAVASLFDAAPAKGDRILYLGNTEPLIEAVEHYCERNDYPQLPGIAVELYEDRLEELRNRFVDADIQFLNLDFLTANLGKFEYVLGHPPNVRADKLVGQIDIDAYRDNFEAARGQFDLAPLYLEQALNHLFEGGRATMILPESVATHEYARPLRQLLATEYHVEELDEFASRALMTNLLVTVVVEEPAETRTPAGTYMLPKDGDGWSRIIEGIEPPVESNIELRDICRRIGAGVATGSDDVFVVPDDDEVLKQIDKEWVYPAIGGKQLAAHDRVESSQRIICPYTSEGRLAAKNELGDTFLQWAELHRNKLENRASIDPSEPWYAWAQRPHLEDLRRPKILTRDFAEEVKFWLDASGEYIPRRSVFYIVPEDHVDLNRLLEYLNRPEVGEWLEAASSGSKRGNRIKTRDLQELPVPSFDASD